MTPAEFGELVDRCAAALSARVGDDWSAGVPGMEWTCRQTAAHMVDCVFSYLLQLASGAPGGYLPFHELEPLPEATPADLVAGLRGMGVALEAVAATAPPGRTASDGLVTLDPPAWCGRAGYEIALHTWDVLRGLGTTFRLPAALAAAVLSSEDLWMIDRAAATGRDDPWDGLLAGSGRRP